jgi:hypothetical protein
MEFVYLFPTNAKSTMKKENAFLAITDMYWMKVTVFLERIVCSKFKIKAAKSGIGK